MAASKKDTVETAVQLGYEYDEPYDDKASAMMDIAIEMNEPVPEYDDLIYYAQEAKKLKAQGVSYSDAITTLIKK